MKQLILSVVFCTSIQGKEAVWQRIPDEVCYDEACYLTSHNSYASRDYGYLYAQQNHSFKKQLALGVRAFKLSIALENGEMVLCHKAPTVTRILSRGKDPMPLKNALHIMKKFLDENPDEVITIFLETYIRQPHDLIDKPFKETRLADLTLKPGDWNFPERRWPTFSWMRSHNKRLLIFNCLESTELCFNQWEHIVENQWGTTHPAKACKERSQSKNYSDYARTLCFLNFFPMVKLSFDNAYQAINTQQLDDFMARFHTYGFNAKVRKGTQKQPTSKRVIPTFLCLDYVDIGNGLAHVMTINTLSRHKTQKNVPFL